MASAQMNVRIDSELKQAGDNSWASIGYSPTAAVRELWRFGQRNQHDPAASREVTRLLRDPDEVAAEEREEQKLHDEQREWLDRGPAEVARICAENGIDLQALAPISPEGYDELLSVALAEDDERIMAES